MAREKKFWRELIRVLEKTDTHVIVTIPAWRGEDEEFGKPDFRKDEFTEAEWEALVVGGRYFAMVNSDSTSMCNLEIRNLEIENINPIERMNDSDISDNAKSIPQEYLAKEIFRLREAIRDHQKKSGNALCWENDLELWRTVDSTAIYNHFSVPGREEFLANCQKYHESRVKGLPYTEAEQKTCAVTKEGKRIES
jgi:hypothetical protein